MAAASTGRPHPAFAAFTPPPARLGAADMTAIVQPVLQQEDGPDRLATEVSASVRWRHSRSARRRLIRD